MKKFRLYFDKDKEEIWINEMSEKGYAFERFFLGVYTFAPCKPGAYRYQIDLLENDIQKEKEFLELMEETEVEIVARRFRWVFLRRKSEQGEFQLYSDNASKATQYERLGRFYMLLLAVELLCSTNIIHNMNNRNFLSLTTIFVILLLSFVYIIATLMVKSFLKAKKLKNELS